MSISRNDTITQANVLRFLDSATRDGRVPMTAGTLIGELTGFRFPESRHRRRMEATLSKLVKDRAIKRFKRTTKEINDKGEEISVTMEGFASIME